MIDNKPLAAVVSHLRGLAEFSQKITGGIEDRRAVLDRYFAVDPSCIETQLPLQEVKIGGRSAYWIVPNEYQGNKRALYIHGGSWISGSLKTYRAFIEKLAIASNTAFLFIDYPLAPEEPYPAGLNSCVEAYQWLQLNGPAGSGPAEKIHLVGDSAGGNLTLCSLLACKERGVVLPDSAVAISPCVDLGFTGESMKTRAEVDPILSPDVVPLVAMAYLQNGEDIKTPTVSPLFGDLSGLPPLMLQTGDAEILLDDSIRFAEAIKAAGGEVKLDIWPAMPHVFQGFAPFLPESAQAIEKIAMFMAGKYS